MNKRMYAIVFAAVLNSGFVQAMEESKAESNTSLSPKEFIVGGVMAGVTMEAVHYIMKEERYKNIFRFGRAYPGFFVAGASAAIGAGMMYSRPVLSFLANRYAEYKSAQ